MPQASLGSLALYVSQPGAWTLLLLLIGPGMKTAPH